MDENTRSYEKNLGAIVPASVRLSNSGLVKVCHAGVALRNCLTPCRSSCDFFVKALQLPEVKVAHDVKSEYLHDTKHELHPALLGKHSFPISGVAGYREIFRNWIHIIVSKIGPHTSEHKHKEPQRLFAEHSIDRRQHVQAK